MTKPQAEHSQLCRKHALSQMPMNLNGIRSGVWSLVSVTALDPGLADCTDSSCTKPAEFSVRWAHHPDEEIPP